MSDAVLKRLKRKYPKLPTVGSAKDWQRIEMMMSRDDYKKYRQLTVLKDIK
jgi:hypothetical protein|tara:strand:+ start:447 stop:599 length:153 start_codon:yes stop_codon:yes gene_type:complete